MSNIIYIINYVLVLNTRINSTKTISKIYLVTFLVNSWLTKLLGLKISIAIGLLTTE